MEDIRTEMVENSPDNGDVIIGSPMSPESARLTRSGLTPSRKRCASRDASSLNRVPVCESPESLSAGTESIAGSDCAASDLGNSGGFLRVETEMMPQISEGQTHHEEMLLYNWQRRTMSFLSSDGIKESLKIEPPLSQILCRASSALIKDNKVFVSLSTDTSYTIQVYDLHSGEFLKQIDDKVLSGSSKIILSSYQHRIYAAAHGGRRIFEIYNNYRLHKVAEVRKGIGNFWVEHQDVSSFLCTYIEARTRNPFTYLRFKARSLDHRLQNYNYAHDMILGCHNGTSYLLPNDRRRIVLVFRDGTAYEFRLAEEIYFPYSLSYCGELIYLLRSDGILVINSKTKHHSIIKKANVAHKVDEECRLIRRLTTPPF